MKLVIVESPAKAKTIEKYLGEDFVVRASVGHIRDLPKSKKDAIDIKAGFVPKYETVKGKEKVIAQLKKLAEDADEVILATDPDREGEAIAWHLAEVLNLKNPKRVEYHEITKEAIKEAFAHPRSIDKQKKQAQEARRVLDRLFGYELSGLIWKKVRYGLSAGRVQSPALRILMEKEREIRAFKPETYFILTAEAKAKELEFILISEEQPKTKKRALEIKEKGEKALWQVKDIKEQKVSRAPAPPFITSTLQQTASSRLGFSPSQTMRLAQKLYEAGFITYMRTDSPTLSKQALAQMHSLIKQKYGEDFLQPRTFKSKSKSAQEAHEAIRPSDFSKTVAGGSAQERKLYDLIYRRTLASQMADALILRSKLMVSSESDDLPIFSIKGQRILSDGWLLVFPEAKSDDVLLPQLSVGDKVSIEKIEIEEKQTTPPKRYTEAGLIKELEQRGIGRPSTYATIIKTLQDRGYVIKEGRTLIPTDTGEVVSSFLEKHFGKYVADAFTAEMEKELDEIAQGQRKYKETLQAFWDEFEKEVKSKSDVEKLTVLGPAPEEFKCPDCRAPMQWRLSKSGKFMSCSRFPDCLGARKVDGSTIEPPKETGEPCPVCGVGGEKENKKKPGVLIEREGRFGRFTACSNYPKCKYVKKDEQLNSTGVKCPQCKEGEIVEKRGRFGAFYACSKYPDCKFTMKARPTGEVCSLCGSLMMEGTKTIPERCSNKQCPNHNPHKLNK